VTGVPTFGTESRFTMSDIGRCTPFDRFWQALAGWASRAAPDLAAWASLPIPGQLPPPWLTWTLIALVRHRRRQLWIGDIVRARLDGDLLCIARIGSLGHPEGRPQQGPVPGWPEWEYFFHGIGCCLTHRVTGEEIDVNFFGDHAEGFDFFFFLNYLRSLRAPEPPERRLIELHASREPIRLAFDELQALGLLATDPDCRAPRLTPDVVSRADSLDAFCQAWSQSGQRAWLSALVGDWPDAQAHLPPDTAPALAQLVTERAEAVRRARLDQLRLVFDQNEEARLALLALADAGAEDLPAYLVRVLRGAVSGATSSALEIIEQRPDAPTWCPEVYRLLRRLDPSGEAPHPYLLMGCARFLVRHGHQVKQVATVLASVGAYMVGEAALLALEYAPEMALPLFRRALRSSVPVNRSTAAAVLALIDQPWSRAELLAILRESEDQEMTCESRAALGESRDPAAWRAVAEWEERNPHEPESGPWISLREMALRHQPEWLLDEMDKLRERVASLTRSGQLPA
jgi:hypothetical protein